MYNNWIYKGSDKENNKGEHFLTVLVFGMYTNIVFLEISNYDLRYDLFFYHILFLGFFFSKVEHSENHHKCHESIFKSSDTSIFFLLN